MSSRFSTAAPHFKEWAEALVQSAEPLRHVVVEEIMFLEDTETETKSDTKKYMELKKIPEFVEDFLGRHFGVTRKAYAVIIYRLNCGALDNAAMVAHLAEQLLKIPDEGRGLVQPDIKTFTPLAKALGFNWKEKIQQALPNLLNEKLPGWPARAIQGNLFDGQDQESELEQRRAAREDAEQGDMTDEEWEEFQARQQVAEADEEEALRPTGTEGH